MTFFLPRKSCRDIFLRSFPSKYCSVKSGATLPTFRAGPEGLAGASPKAAELASRSNKAADRAFFRIIHLYLDSHLLWRLGSAVPLYATPGSCGTSTKVAAHGRCRALHCAPLSFSVHC